MDFCCWPINVKARESKCSVSRSRGIGLETRLQLGQGAQAVLLGALVDVVLGGDAGLAGVGAVVQRALENLDGVVAAAERDELVGGDPRTL